MLDKYEQTQRTQKKKWRKTLFILAVLLAYSYVGGRTPHAAEWKQQQWQWQRQRQLAMKFEIHENREEANVKKKNKYTRTPNGEWDVKTNDWIEFYSNFAAALFYLCQRSECFCLHTIVIFHHIWLVLAENIWTCAHPRQLFNYKNEWEEEKTRQMRHTQKNSTAKYRKCMNFRSHIVFIFILPTHVNSFVSAALPRGKKNMQIIQWT